MNTSKPTVLQQVSNAIDQMLAAPTIFIRAAEARIREELEAESRLSPEERRLASAEKQQQILRFQGRLASARVALESGGGRSPAVPEGT